MAFLVSKVNKVNKVNKPFLLAPESAEARACPASNHQGSQNAGAPSATSRTCRTSSGRGSVHWSTPRRSPSLRGKCLNSTTDPS